MIPTLSVPTDGANCRGIISAVPLREGLGFTENIMAQATPAVNKKNKKSPEFGSPVNKSLYSLLISWLTRFAEKAMVAMRSENVPPTRRLLPAFIVGWVSGILDRVGYRFQRITLT